MVAGISGIPVYQVSDVNTAGDARDDQHHHCECLDRAGNYGRCRDRGVGAEKDPDSEQEKGNHPKINKNSKEYTAFLFSRTVIMPALPILWISVTVSSIGILVMTQPY